MERTCVIVKPDGVGRRAVGAVIARLEREGLHLRALRMVRPDRRQMEEFYAIHVGKPFFEPFMRFVCSGPIVVSVWDGPDAIVRVRAAIGATDSRAAAPGTLRREYGTDNRRNLVHASDSVENGLRESTFFFTPGEMMEYDHEDWKNA